MSLLEHNTRSSYPAIQAKLADWSAILISHHQDLHQEVQQITTLLDSPDSLFLQLEARLRRLGHAVRMHLELEDSFLNPALQQNGALTPMTLQRLQLGYDDLHDLVASTLRFIHQEKQISSSLQLTSAQAQTVRHLLAEICQRLDLEDGIYQPLTEPRDELHA